MRSLIVFTILLAVNLSAMSYPPVTEMTIKTSAKCAECYDNIQREFTYAKGVKSFAIDYETGDLTVKYNPGKTDPDKIRKAISKAGYDADDVPADPKAYDKLDDCCKKGAAGH